MMTIQAHLQWLGSRRSLGVVVPASLVHPMLADENAALPQPTITSWPVRGLIRVTTQGKTSGMPFQSRLTQLAIRRSASQATDKHLTIDREYQLIIDQATCRRMGVSAGDQVVLSVEQDTTRDVVRMVPALRAALKAQHLLPTWEARPVGYQRQHLRYLWKLKSTEGLRQNIFRIIEQLQLMASK